MKNFHKLNKLFQWAIGLFFGLLLLLILYWWIAKVDETKLWILLIFIIVPVIQFLTTPIFTILKFYTYYSPMVVVFGNNKRVIDLHNGTSFDYLLEMSGVAPGLKWKKKMLSFYLHALSTIIQQIEEEKLPDSVIIRGSSYFLSERSAKKLGFTYNKTPLFEKLNILLNYFDLIWMYSLTNGKLTFPNLANINTARITGTELVKNKERLSDLLGKLN